MADLIGRHLALFYLVQELSAVELVQFLQVPEEDVPLAPERLRHVLAQQLRHVVIDDELQRPHVIPLRLDHLTHYQSQRPGIATFHWLKHFPRA